MSISTPFIQRPIATSLLMAGVLLAGAVAYPLLPVAPLPQVDFPTIQVSAQLPGASAETMASTVAQPLERQFSQIAGVGQLTSTSTLGSTSITVQFDLDRNIDAAAQDIQTAINAAGGQLPKNLPSPPTYRKTNPADAPILLLSATSEVLPLTTVDNYADTILAQQISRLPGVGYVLIGGEQKPAVRVQVDPLKLAQLGMSIDDVRSVLAVATVNAPKGSVDGPLQNFTIYTNDQLLAAEAFNDVIIAYRNGAPVRVRDVGRAIDGPQDAKQAAWAKTPAGLDRAVVLIIFKSPGANVIDTVDRIKAALPQVKASIPPAMRIDIISDRTQTIRASVEDVQFTLMITAGLVVLVIFLFLRSFWATVIPSVAVPLSIIGTFGAMYLAGYSLDNISLMALVIAVGFVVDDAIVVIENITRYIEQGEKPVAAAIKGAGEIGFTIVSISLSLVAVFLPLLLMGGIIGRLFHEFAVTVTMAIAVSAAVSLTVTPMMSARFLRSTHETHHGRVFRWSERVFDAMLDFYRRSLGWVLDHRRTTLAVFFASLAAAVFLFTALPKGFFPQQDIGLIFGTSEAAQSVSFDEMSRLQRQVADVVARDPDVEGFITAIGGSSALNTGRFFIQLKPKTVRKASAEQIMARLRPQIAKIPGVALFMQAFQDIRVGGRLARTQYQYTLQDADLDELNEWAPKALEKFKTLPELQDVASDQQNAANTVTIEIDRDQAARFGIQPQAIDDVLYDAFGQRQVAQYFTQLNSYYVVLESTPDQQGRTDSLDGLYVKSSSGRMVPLTTFVKYSTRPVTYLAVNHQGQFPAVTLSFNLAPGTSLGQAVDAIERARTDLRLPATVHGSFQGTAQAFQQSLATQQYLIAGAIIVVYIILGILYESYIHPLTILSTLPSAGLGALLMLMIAGYDLSVIALIGIILLIGIVKKNAIMMIDFALDAERNQGLAPREAIYQACLLRFRPIMMTTMAALLGSLPLMLGAGTGSELRRPLGFAIVGGLLISQALTLFTTPVIYLYMDRLATRLRGSGKRGAPRPQPA